MQTKPNSGFERVRGDLFDQKAACLVNPVNCAGVSGAGLAKRFAAFSPLNQRAYQESCKAHSLRPGGVLMVRLASVGPASWIANAATKDHWSAPSRQEWVESCLTNLVKHCEAAGIRTAALPALGCGLGGLDEDWFVETAKRILSGRSTRFTVVLRR